MQLMANMDDSPTNYNDIWGYTAPTGEEYAIIGTRNEIYVYDVTNCGAPVQIFGFMAGDNTTWRDFKTYKNFVYGVCDSCNEGLHIFDMSALPSGNVTHVNTITSYFGSAHNIYIDAGRLYAIGISGSQDVTILDLASNPSNPPLLAYVDLSTVANNTCSTCYVHDMYVENHIGYASHGWEEAFTVYDFSDPNNVVYKNTIQLSGYNHSSWVDDSREYAYVASEVPSGIPMETVELTNLNSPVNNLSSAGSFIDDITDVGTTPHNPFVCGDYLFISYYEDGVKVYDITDPSTPALQGYYDTDPSNNYGCWGVYPYLESGCILASDIVNGLFTLESTTAGVTGNCSGECPVVTSVIADVTTNQCDSGNGVPVNYAATISIGVNGVDYEIIWRVDGVVQATTTDNLSITINVPTSCSSIKSPEVTALLRCFPNQTTPDAEVQVSSPPFSVFPIPVLGIDYTISNNNCSVSITDLCGSLDITNDQGGGNTFTLAPGSSDTDVVFTIMSDALAPATCSSTETLTASCPCTDILNLAGLAFGVRDYEATDYISSTQTIVNGSKIDYDAVNFVELNQGFEVKLGAEFMAFIDGCNQGGGGINVNTETSKEINK